MNTSITRPRCPAASSNGRRSPAGAGAASGRARSCRAGCGRSSRTGPQTGLRGMIVPRKATSPRRCSVSTWKYERVKLNTIAGLVLGEQHGVGGDPAGLVHERDHDRVDAARDAAHTAARRRPGGCGRTAAERCRSPRRAPGRSRRARRRSGSRRARGPPTRTAGRGAPAAGRPARPCRRAGGRCAPPTRAPGAGGRRSSTNSIAGSTPARGEHSPRHRVEEGLRELGVGQARDGLRVGAVGGVPERPLVEALAEPRPQALEGRFEAGSVQVEPLGGVHAQRRPVRAGEAVAGARGVAREALPVGEKRLPDEPGAVAGRPAHRSLSAGRAALRRRGSRPSGRRRAARGPAGARRRRRSPARRRAAARGTAARPTSAR